MKRATIKLYRVQDFAGVTVRTLHYYDRIGLLKPSGRSDAGYRLYAARDLERLEQIIVLKFLGLPLSQIRDLLNRDAVDLPTALRLQRQVLEERRRQIDSAIHAIHQAERAAASGREPDWQIFQRIIEVMEMQKNMDWTQKYYSPEARAKIEERKSLWSPELQERVSKGWMDLISDVEAALGEDPASPKAQALADRWQKLVEGFTGGDPQISKGLNALYADSQNWPGDFQKVMQPYNNPAVRDFMDKVMAARK